MNQIKCPIPHCTHVFSHGIGGWDAHVASLTAHPGWMSRVKDGDDRKRAFALRYPDFIERALTRRHVSGMIAKVSAEARKSA